MKSEYYLCKNLVTLGFGHFLVFSAFDSLSNLQSTLNRKSGVGIASQSIIYAFFTISSFFLPTFFIKRFGCKRTLVISVFSICPYIAANAYPGWITLIPSAILSGFAFGPLWAARSAYVNEISFRYSELRSLSVGIVNAWFFGIYSFFHENAEIWGNVISYYILRQDIEPMERYSVMTNYTIYSECGADFCDDSVIASNPNLNPPSTEKRWTLVSVYFCFVVAAGFIIHFLLDPLSSEENLASEEKEKVSPSSSLFRATFKHMKNKRQLLLIPLSFYCGLADGFYNSDFTKSFVACAWGISQVGQVTICYGVVSAVMDCSLGLMVKYLRRIPVFLLAASSHLAMLIVLLVLKPAADNFMLYVILSGVYGVGASVWWSQIIAFYGVIFKDNEEPAFSNFYFWSSLGFSVAYGYSDVLCTRVKIYMLIALLLISITSYIAVEIKCFRESKTLCKRLTPEKLVLCKETKEVCTA